MVTVKVSIHYAIITATKTAYRLGARMIAKVVKDLLFEAPLVFAELDGAENYFDKLLGLRGGVIAKIHFEKVL